MCPASDRHAASGSCRQPAGPDVAAGDPAADPRHALDRVAPHPHRSVGAARDHGHVAAVDRLDRAVEQVAATEDEAEGRGRRFGPGRREPHARDLVEVKLQRRRERSRPPGECGAVSLRDRRDGEQLARQHAAAGQVEHGRRRRGRRRGNGRHEHEEREPSKRPAGAANDGGGHGNEPRRTRRQERPGSVPVVHYDACGPFGLKNDPSGPPVAGFSAVADTSCSLSRRSPP